MFTGSQSRSLKRWRKTKNGRKLVLQSLSLGSLSWMWSCSVDLPKVSFKIKLKKSSQAQRLPWFCVVDFNTQRPLAPEPAGLEGGVQQWFLSEVLSAGGTSKRSQTRATSGGRPGIGWLLWGLSSVWPAGKKADLFHTIASPYVKITP